MENEMHLFGNSQPFRPIIPLVGEVQRDPLDKHETRAIERGIEKAARNTEKTVLVSTDNGLSKIADNIHEKLILVRTFSTTFSIEGGWDDTLEDYLNGNRGRGVVCIVVGGDKEFLLRITRIARNIDNIKLVVVEGHGNATDFLSFICKSECESSITSAASRFFGVQPDDSCIQDLKFWQLPKNKLNVWCSNEDTGLDVLIENALFALFKDFEQNTKSQLNITTAWNRYDLAEQISLCSDKVVLKEYLIKGLEHNEVFFVRKCLRCYGDFEGTLTPKELYNIYKESVKVDRRDGAARLFMNLLFPLEVDWPEDNVTFFSDVGKFIENLLADTYLNPYKNCKGAALFASAVLRKLSKCAKEFEELSRSMKKNAKNFEYYASCIVSEMSTRDVKSQDLLVSVVEEYGDTTPLYIAGNNDLMNFMEQTPCQEKLTEIWNGNIYRNTSLIKKLGCIFFPIFLLPKMIQFNSPKWRRGMKISPESTNSSYRYYTIFSGKQKNRIELFEAIYSFYSAPVIKFMTLVSFYAVYLMTFSIMIITDLHDGGVSFLEKIVMFWTAAFLLEEFRQVIEEDQPSPWSKIKLWFSRAGNKFDAFAYVMLMLSIVARISLPTSMFRWARYSYSVTVVIFWWNSMRFLFVHRHIGPKVVMIGKMLRDLVFLFIIFAVVVISVGIAYTANIYPNSIFNWATVKKIVFYPYWQLHGELFLDYIRGREPDPPGDCTYDPVLSGNGTLPACPVVFDMVTMIAAVYLVLLNIILVNVLIAMFSYTFLKVQRKAGKVAKFHNYFLVYEYSNMPTLIAPFNVINMLYKMITLCCREKENEFKIRLSNENKKELMDRETEALQTTVLNYLEQNGFKQLNYRLLQKAKENTKQTSKLHDMSNYVENIL